MKNQERITLAKKAIRHAAGTLYTAFREKKGFKRFLRKDHRKGISGKHL
jgi:hypothetical protein